jgi:Mu transposase-like protein
MDSELPGTESSAGKSSDALEFHRSSNGDRWFLCRYEREAPVVRHVPNAASAGTVSELAVGAFLSSERRGPEHDALKDLLSALILKSAVLERQGDAIRFHPTLLAFAAHYRFEPRPVAVARGNEKGRVKRAIRHVRDAFFAARQFTDLDNLNAQAEHWCRTQAADRPCPEDRAISVRQAFAQEQPTLLALPENPYPVEETLAVKVGKTPYVRFDLNDYSIPHTHVRRTLTVRADLEQIRVLDGAEVIARHDRSYDRRTQIEEPAHIETLVGVKREARHHRGMDRLVRAAPASQELLRRAAERSANLGTITAALLRLLDRYGAAQLQAAIGDALERGVPHPNAVRLALERRREARQLPPPLAVCLPPHVRQKDTPVQPHRLDTYDQLAGGSDELA